MANLLRLLTAWLLILFSMTVKSCPNADMLMEIEFAKNSSYFNSQGKVTLDKLVTDAVKLPHGYLLLESSSNKQISNKRLREYNMWLAERRIDRIKTYLTQNLITSPMVTRIRTARNGQRMVTLSFCPH